MIKKILSLRGILYRKIKKAGKEKAQKTFGEEILPGFAVMKPKRIVEFPDITDITKVNVIYPLLEPFAYAQIKWNPETKELIYNVLEPKMSEEDKKILKKISEGLIELVDVELSSIKEPSKVIEYLEKNVIKVIKELGLKLTQEQYVKIMYYIYRNFVGLNEIEPFMQDPNIEDISCDGVKIPFYVVHRKYGSLKTNVVFEDMEELRELVVKLAERCGRYVSYAEPILDGTLPDGSRVAATLAPDVATRGPVITIRKFGERPFSPIEQMEMKTASSSLLAYFWYLMEHGISMLIIGGVATGKTSFLNTLCMFIPPEAKIISIEDTRELRIPNEHWVPTLARPGFGIPMPSGEKYGGVSLFDLLKESFRQNPDYVIVGETRGEEAYVMFQGISSGHPSLSTMHAGSVETLIKRLTTPPIELSPTLIEGLDVVVVMIHAREKGKSARRVKEVVEIESVDPKTNEVKYRVIFRWNPETDEYEKIADSIKVAKVTLARGGKVEDAWKEIKIREKVLEWMKAKGIKEYTEVVKMLNLYRKDRKKFFEIAGEEFEKIEGKEITMPKLEKEAFLIKLEEREKPEKRKKIPLLQILGFKILREKDDSN
ncbi:MAG: type II/IV secretion system ATPase subunit [Candidatus Aenigmatarchaeota archaeon]